MSNLTNQNLLLDLKVQECDLLRHKRSLLKAEALKYYRPHAKQQAFHVAGHNAPERLFLAGNRCGKTLAGAAETVMHLTGLYPEGWCGVQFDGPIEAWAASVTTEATRDILQPLYLSFIPPERLLKTVLRRGVGGAVDQLSIQHVSGGISTLGFKSYDQGREKFQGTARHVIHLDEEPEIGIYEECLLRTLTVQGHMLLTMTPLLGMTSLCQSFLQAEAGSGKAVVQATWADAPHLSAADQSRLQHSLRPGELEARMNGVPSIGSGRIYPVKETEVTVPRFAVPDYYKQAFGIDFGWTNPTAIVWGAYDHDQDVIYLTDVYQRSQMAPAEHAQRIHQAGEWIPGVCDPSGQSAHQADGQNLIEMYRQHGVSLTLADNSVESGLMQVLERLQTGRLKVFEDLTPWLEEFRLYRRNAQGRVVKTHDHLMDATRYLVVSGLTLAKPKPSGRQLQRAAAEWWAV